MLALSLKLPSSTWLGALVPVEELRDICIRSSCLSLEEEPGPCPKLHDCFLTTFPLFLHSFPPLISNCLHLPFGIQGKSRKLKLFSYKQVTGDTERLLYPGGPHSLCLVSVVGDSPCCMSFKNPSADSLIWPRPATPFLRSD